MSLSFTLNSDRDVALFLSRLDAALAETQAADFLRGRGYRVEKDEGTGWTTPSALSLELGLNACWLSRLLGRGTKPPGLEIHRAGAGRRITAVRPSAEFYGWARSRGGRRG